MKSVTLKLQNENWLEAMQLMSEAGFGDDANENDVVIITAKEFNRHLFINFSSLCEQLMELFERIAENYPEEEETIYSTMEELREYILTAEELIEGAKKKKYASDEVSERLLFTMYKVYSEFKPFADMAGMQIRTCLEE